jgi:hypothetical protein
MITEQVAAYLQQCITMPVLPATLLMLLIVCYGLLVILGAVDFDLIDFDVDIDADADLGTVSSAGFVTLKFLNIGEVPVMIWLCIYGLLWWVISQLLWLFWDKTSIDPNTTLLLVRNVAASLMLTKLLTNPLAKVFAKPARFRPDDLVGRECEISTYEATTEFGQAKCLTNAAPLILDVRMEAGTLSKGEFARITDYDPQSKIHYLVAASDPP